MLFPQAVLAPLSFPGVGKPLVLAITQLSVTAAAIEARRSMPKLVHMDVGRHHVWSDTSAPGPPLHSMEASMPQSQEKQLSFSDYQGKGNQRWSRPPHACPRDKYHSRLQSPGFSIICPRLKSPPAKLKRYEECCLSPTFTGVGLCPLNNIKISHLTVHATYT